MLPRRRAASAGSVLLFSLFLSPDGSGEVFSCPTMHPVVFRYFTLFLRQGLPLLLRLASEGQPSVPSSGVLRFQV